VQYVIGCDVGTQSTKAVLISLAGALCGTASAAYPVQYPHPLWAEQRVEDWTSALVAAVRQLLHETGTASADIVGLGLATQVDGVVPVDAAQGALRSGIIWMDRRAVAQCAAVRQQLSDGEAFRLTGLNLDPCHVAPKIRWIADEQPTIDGLAVRYLLPGSYLALWLTGEIAVDYSNASSTLLLDVNTRQWSPLMCNAFGLDEARLAPLCAANTPLGTLRAAVAEAMGLRPGTLVVAGSGDEHAACLGAGVVAEGIACDVAGTAEPVCCASAMVKFDETRLIETHCHAASELWLMENSGFVSGGNVAWYRDHFGGEEVRAAAAAAVSPYRLFDEAAAAIVPGAEGMIFLPCLMGATTPTWNEDARGVFYGFTLRHTRAHFTRALLEGSAYAVRDITDRMQAIGLGLDELRIVGGGAKSRLWNQIKADVTGLVVTVPEITETTALGAAMLALVGVGACASLSQAVELAVRIRERFEPQTAAQTVYERQYSLYRLVYASLLSAFDKSARLNG
jgi:xylulokinase